MDMGRQNRGLHLGKYFFVAICVFFAVCSASRAQDPSVNATFEQAAQGMRTLGWYNFGTGSGCTVCNQQQLANSFNPYGIAGTTVIHTEWERYQPFNGTNFTFTGNTLNLNAVIPQNGGLYPGGINSGQIWTKQTFQPGKTGYNTYAFLVRMKIPNGQGMWPAAWLYSARNADASEVDITEFQMMQWQNQYDWTGNNHGPGVGSKFFSRLTNPWVWHPGTDFSADYHDYELVWTTDAVFQYVDSQLIQAQYFRWTASGPAQLGINLAVGSSDPGATGLTPTSTSEFPRSLSIQYIAVMAK
jgi:beta-glucanase (GH16 family)